MKDSNAAQRYWRANLKLIAVLLVIWFSVSFGAGILFVDWLDQFVVAGFPVGFWFAQQGSILTFVVLIIIYMLAMNRLDKRFGLDESTEGGHS